MSTAVRKSSKIITERRTVRAEETEREDGSALVMAVFMLVLIGVMGMGLMFMSVTEMKMSKAGLRAKQAFYMAEAAEEIGRATLWELNGAEDFTDRLKQFAGPDDTFQFQPQNLQLIRDSDGDVTGVDGFDNDIPLLDVTNFAGGQYVAFLTNDPDEGWETTDDFNKLVMITGVGAGPESAGRSCPSCRRRRSRCSARCRSSRAATPTSTSMAGTTAAVSAYPGSTFRSSGRSAPRPSLRRRKESTTTRSPTRDRTTIPDPSSAGTHSPI
jgi:hypothetical protein